MNVKEHLAELFTLAGAALATGAIAAVRQWLQARMFERARTKAVELDNGELARFMSDPPPPPPNGELDPLSRKLIVDLHDSIRPLAVELLRNARDAGIRLAITSGYRSLDQQRALYEQGRTKPGKIVTNARPGTSWHNFGLAFDVAPLDSKGRPHWPNDLKLWQRIGELGELVGLSWGGRWKTPDLPHFEFHPNLSLRDAQNGARPPV